MNYTAAYNLLFLSGKANPSVEDVEALMYESGNEVDRQKLVRLCSKLGSIAWHERFYNITKTSFKPNSTLSRRLFDSHETLQLLSCLLGTFEFLRLNALCRSVNSCFSSFCQAVQAEDKDRMFSEVKKRFPLSSWHKINQYVTKSVFRPSRVVSDRF